MKFITLAVILVLVSIARVLAVAQEFHPVVGRYALTTSNMVDPEPGARPDRTILFIEGSAAKEMYDGMTQKPMKDQCAIDLISKKAGNLVCSKLNSGKFFCTFGVSLKDGRILNGRAC
jgi:hypothetical protein